MKNALYGMAGLLVFEAMVVMTLWDWFIENYIL